MIMDLKFNKIFRSPMQSVFPFSLKRMFAGGEQGFWFEPSDLSTLFQDTARTTPVTAPGQPVALMLDKSGNDFHATQPGASLRPTYQIDTGGRGYLFFGGGADPRWMQTPTITPGIDKVQVFAGVRKLSDAGLSMVAELSAASFGNAGTFSVTAPQSSSASYGFNSRGSGTLVSAFYTNAVVAAPTTNAISAFGDISGDTATLRIDGRQVAQSTSDQGTGNYLAYPMYIGCRAGTSLFLNGHLYSLIARFGQNLSAQRIRQVEHWVAEGTGVIL